MSAILPGTIGAFTSLNRSRRRGLRETSHTAESFGFSTLWLADVRGDLSFFPECLTATDDLVVATSVLSIWDLPASAAARALAADTTGRAILGVGVSHPAMAPPGTYRRPLESLTRYLDDLAAEGAAADRQILGANGERMLECAGRRTAGAVTQLVTPERTADQRKWLGEGALLATELKIVVDGDRDDARRLGRANLANYLGLPGYQKNLRAQGFTDDDLTGGGSDRLVDALVAGPDPASIRDAVESHRDAGAAHICAHVLADTDEAPLDQWRTLSAILELPRREDSR